MKVMNLVAAVDTIAAFRLARPDDNVGLLVGDPEASVDTALVCLDVAQPVIEEARSKGAQAIVARHPLIYQPMRAVTSATAVGRLVQELARAGVAVIAAHTNLDAAPGGGEDTLAETIGLTQVRPLLPASEGQVKVVVFTSERDVAAVQRAAFEAGAGVIGAYTECSFRSPGTGTFLGGEGAHPAVGRAGQREEVSEFRLEFLAPRDRLEAVLDAVRRAHSYEEPAIDVYPLLDAGGHAGLGRVGTLPQPQSGRDLLRRLCRAFGCPGALVGGDVDRPISRVAAACGSGGASVAPAIAAGAECFVTGELRHHQALEAVEGGLTVLAAGHACTERLVLPRLVARLAETLPGLRVELSERDRPPLLWHTGQGPAAGRDFRQRANATRTRGASL